MILANENMEASSAVLNNPSIERGQVPVVDAKAVTDFRAFLEKNRDDLKTGMGAFHHDGHSNW
jgi:hypothetical protein